MSTVLVLIALAAFAYVLAHYVVERLQARFLVTGGAEYLILGLLIGPNLEFGQALSAETLTSLYPVISLVIGGVGLLYGLQANFKSLLLRQDGASTIAFTAFMTTGAAVGAGAWLLLQTSVVGAHPREATGAGAWVLATSAAVSSAGAMELIKKRFHARGALTELLDGTMRAAELFAIVAFGLAFCVYHQADPLHLGWNYANWIVVTLVVGVGLGFLFRAFIGDHPDDDDHIFLAILGIIVFGSGAAYYLQLTPLLICLILGAVLANIARCADQILATMERLRRPVSIMLLVLAGALWTPIAPAGWLVVAAYLALRFSAKLLGGWAASLSVAGVPRDVGRGLLGHGDVAIAMVVSYRIVYEGPVVDIVFTAVLASVVLAELTSARQLKGLLIDGGDIQRDDRGEPPPDHVPQPEEA